MIPPPTPFVRPRRRCPIPNDYNIGYGKPPQHTRFKAGQSGNPKGRPKGTKNLKTDLEEELREFIVVREGGNPRTVSKQRAMLKSLTAKAIQGDSRAAATVLGLIERYLDAEPASADPSGHLATHGPATDMLRRRIEEIYKRIAAGEPVPE